MLKKLYLCQTFEEFCLFFTCSRKGSNPPKSSLGIMEEMTYESGSQDKREERKLTE